MKHFAIALLVVWTQLSAGLLLGPAIADENDLSGGVLIAHCPPGIEFTTPPPPEGWCDRYLYDHAIECCEEQHPMIATEPGEGSVWFVLAAWEEEKVFCGLQFGFEDYDSDIYEFVEWGYCCPGENCLDIPTDGWPGPMEGVGFVTYSGEPWIGNFVPVYYFVGYAYDDGVIPISKDPQLQYTDSASVANCIGPYYEEWDFVCHPAMGIMGYGEECCPEDSPSPVDGSTWGAIKHLYR